MAKIEENFYYTEGHTLVKNIIKDLTKEFTESAKLYKWTLVYPSSLSEIKNFSLIKCTTTYKKDFYISLEKEEGCLNYITVCTGKEIEERTITKKVKKEGEKEEKEVTIKRTDIKEGMSSVPARLAWYRDITSKIIKEDFLPVEYWITQTKDSINLILRGDPSADNYPYKKYLTSYAYFGALKPLEDASTTDDEYNFGITVSSDKEPDYTKKFGDRTATGVTDICMTANKIGLPMQVHNAAFYTTHAFMDKCNVEGSRWNHKKHQFSDITLVHPVDMERGKMENVLVGDGSAIYDNDKLVYKKDTDKEENYKKFKITAPYSFLNNTANNLYVVAIRCYKTAE